MGWLVPHLGAERAPHEPIRLRDRGLLAILAGALVLQLVALARIDGYQIADAVEYMDRANMFASGESFDPRTPRPFTFSGLMSPFFAAANALELESYVPIVGLMRAVQMLVGLLSVWITARIGSRIGGRGFGLVAGAFLAFNVAFLRYTVTPVADPGAMLFMALGLETMLAGRDRKRGFLTGLFLGSSVLFAYKSLPMTGVLLGGLFLRERFSRMRWWVALAGGFVACLGVGATADAFIYGRFGSSIDGYLQNNAVSIVARVVFHAGFEDEGRWIYNEYSTAEEIDQVKATASDVSSLVPDSWFYENLHVELLAWPLLLLLLVGLVAAALPPRHPTGLYLLVSAVSFFLISNKGYKDFRLFFPVLPMVSVLGALGWRVLQGGHWAAGPAGQASSAGGSQANTSLSRRLMATGVVLLGVLLTPRMLFELNLGEHAGYWRAIEIVNAEAAQERAELRANGLPAPPRRVGSAYHWAVALRQTRDVELIRLPMEIVTYVRRSDREKYDSVRDELLDTIDSYDWFLAHMQALWQSPEIMEVVGRRFEVHTLLYDAETYEGMAPICVLRRRRAEPDARTRTFFDEMPGRSAAEADEYRAGLQHPVGLVLRHQPAEGSLQEIELLGFDIETGLGPAPSGEAGVENDAGGDLAWVTYHWYARTDGVDDFAIFDRFTDPDGRAGWLGLDYHRPAYAVRDTSGWQAGTILRESYPRMLPVDPHAFGGDHRRGELLPVELWMSVQRGFPGQVDAVRMEPWNAAEQRPYRAAQPQSGESRANHDGRVWDRDGRVLIGGSWIPVPRDLRIPDDGRPLATDF